jgi:hypothetical protein
MCVKTKTKKVRVGAGQYLEWIEGFTIKRKKKHVGINLILLPLASKTSIFELHGKPRAPSFPCLPCCTILAGSEVGS